MDTFLSNLRKPAKLLVMIFAGAYALFQLLYAIGIMSQGGTDLVFGGLLFLLLFIGLVGVLLFSLITKKEKPAKLIGYVFFSFIFLQSLFGLLNGVQDDSAVASMIFIFDIFATLCLVAVFALILLKTFSEKLATNKIITIIQLGFAASFLLFTLIARFLEFGVYGEIAKAWDTEIPWYYIMKTISNILVLPALMFGYILLFTKKSNTEKSNDMPVKEKTADGYNEATPESQTTSANFCPVCGAQSNGNAFCPNCGTKL